MKYLIKYSAEIGTKSNNVKHKFHKRLLNNIIDALQNNLTETNFQACKYKSSFNHIELISPVEVGYLLGRIAGVQYFTSVEEKEFRDPDQIAGEAGAFFRNKVKQRKSFAVKCKKSINEKVSGREIERKVGDQLVPYGKVNLNEPAITCFVEIRKTQAFFYDTKVPGPGGLPIGQQGKTLTLFSGGIDSPVAAWMIYNTGMDQDLLYFDLGSGAQRQNALEAYKYLKQSWGHGATSRFIEIDFIPVIKEILNAPGPYQNLILKYFFYKVAEKVAEIRKLPALATGEALGQVSTQTLQNMVALDKITSLLVIRPLSNLPKDNITLKAKEIGTFEIAYRGKEFCALSTKNVVTGGRYNQLIREVEKLDLSLVDQVVTSRKIYNMHKGEVVLEMENPASEEIISRSDQREKPGLETSDRIIDLQSPEIFKNNALPGSENIPFHQALQEFYHWDKAYSYFIVCEAGNNSRVLASYMEEEGFCVNHLEGGMENASTEEFPHESTGML